MKIFTIFTAIIWVMTFVSGMYGMNVRLPGQESEYMFYVIIMLMTLVIGWLLRYFKQKSWLR
jgi:magnesium transporter